MKILIIVLVLWHGFVFGAEVAYNFKSMDDAFIEDIDDDGTLLINTLATINSIHPKNSRRNTTFNCGDVSFGTSISKGRIVGACDDGAFVRGKNGEIFILSALGGNAISFGIAEDGTVGGQYCTPNGPPNFGCTLHGFTWHPNRGYQTIDYIDGRPGTHTLSHVIAPTSNGCALGEYFVFDQNNNTLEHGYYLYCNGIFDTVSLPKSFEYIGGEGVFIADMNELGQIIIQRWNTTTPRLELYDDGKLYPITGWPTGWILQQLKGGNQKGIFVGRYTIQIGTDPFFNWPIYKNFGFIATPIKAAREKN